LEPKETKRRAREGENWGRIERWEVRELTKTRRGRVAKKRRPRGGYRLEPIGSVGGGKSTMGAPSHS